jgi:hypothetical protein
MILTNTPVCTSNFIAKVFTEITECFFFKKNKKTEEEGRRKI